MILPLLILILSTGVKPCLAVSPTITPIPTTIESPVPTNVDEIKKIRDLVKEKLKQITNPTSTKKGIIGKIIQTSITDVTIEYQNTTRNILIDDTTTFIDQNRNKTKLDKVKIGQDVLILGIENSDANTFEGKRIVFIDPKTLTAPKTVVVGKIVDLSKSSPIFTLIPSKNKNSLFQIKTDTKTSILTTDQTKIKTSDLKSGQKIIAILTPDLKMSKTYYAIQIINLDYQLPTATPKP